MFAQMIEDRKTELVERAKNEQRACDTAASMAPVIEQQLEPLRALSGFTVSQAGPEIRVRFERRYSPVTLAPSLVVKVACPTNSDTAVTAFIYTERLPGRTEEKPISYEFTTVEDLVQRVLKSCEADFQRMISRWVT